MSNKSTSQGFLGVLGQIFWHIVVVLLAASIAFSLPSMAKYILYGWWPRVAGDTNLLLVTEIAFASVLMLLFHLIRIIWINRKCVTHAKLAALVHARTTHKNWLSRWRERGLTRRFPAARDAFILTLTGYDTFLDKNSMLHQALDNVYDIRVMLLNPIGAVMRKRIESMPHDITLASFQSEIEASIAYLKGLRKNGKRIMLKFYNHEPFWKVIVLDDHVWVQHCHAGFEVKQQPEYVFALQHHDPRQGMYVPFYMYFLDRWNEHHHPYYDFDTHELVYRDSTGSELFRAPFGVPLASHVRTAASTNPPVDLEEEESPPSSEVPVHPQSAQLMQPLQ
ncbi:MAG: hypothetical protein HY080_05400 [Gammaproteobacteria bacterium]|nr:hypothetical protein [Gammaproteobacteria bacterium]